MQYFYVTHPNWAWNASIAILILGILSTLVLHHRLFLAIGSAGTTMFLLNIKDTLFSDILSKNILFIISIIIIMLVAMLTEYLVSTRITIFNIFFDIIIAVLTLFFVDRFSASNSWVLPIGLLIFFILVICFNFDANYRNDKITTESKLFSSDSEDDSEDSD